MTGTGGGPLGCLLPNPDPKTPRQMKNRPEEGGRSIVGVTGFEPAASSSRTTRATKLRYAPTERQVLAKSEDSEFLTVRLRAGLR